MNKFIFFFILAFSTVVYAGVDLNGDADYINMGDPAGLDVGTGSFTYGGVFNSSDVNTYTINKRDTSSPFPGYDILIGGGATAGDVRCRVESFNSSLWSGTDDGNNHCVACVVDTSGNELKIYGDGAEIGSATNISAMGDNDNARNFNIGARNGGNVYDGQISNAWVIGRALNDSEVENMCDSNIKRMCINIGGSDLLGCWPFDDYAGGTALNTSSDGYFDVSGNGNHGTGVDGDGDSTNENDSGLSYQ